MPAVAIRLGLLAAVALSLLPFLRADTSRDSAAVKTATFSGKVVPLSGLLEERGVKLDADAAAQWLALASDDGSVYPLVKDNGSRMLFKDARLRQQPLRLTGRLVPGTQLLQVFVVYSNRDGQAREVYYWCDVCSIRRTEPNDCDCCGGPLELREDPPKR